MYTTKEQRQRAIDDPGRVMTDDFGAEDIVRLARDADMAEELLEVLEAIVYGGQWFISALELDDEVNGEKLRDQAQTAITKARNPPSDRPLSY